MGKDCGKVDDAVAAFGLIVVSSELTPCTALANIGKGCGKVDDAVAADGLKVVSNADAILACPCRRVPLSLCVMEAGDVGGTCAPAPPRS